MLSEAAAPLLGRCTFPPAGTELACAVSGGVDSLALLALAVFAGCEATAYHVDHGIRPDSAGEAEVVREAAGRLGANFVPLTVNCVAGPNLEARARSARFSVLPGDVATGHTADDQAETVLINLLRGSGLDGLSAMAPGYRHPILGLRRSETRALVASLGLSAVEDPSNADPAFRRNRIRHELLPLAAEIAERDVVPVFARQARLFSDEADLLDELAASIDPTDAKALAASPPALARRALRSWLRSLGLDEHPPDAAAIERILTVARGEVVACEIANGHRISRSKGRMRLDRLEG